MKKIEKAIALGLIIAITASTISGFSAFAKQCDGVRNSVLRLHIVANSDSEADQSLKLKVKDSILNATDELFVIAKTKDEALEDLKKKLPSIQLVAEGEVQKEGYDYKVKAEIVNMYFPTKKYGDVTMPAGYYDALRLIIGEGKGSNWWCVLFPPICLPSAEDYEKLSDVLNGKQLAIVLGEGDRAIVLKFKVLEWFESLKKFLFGDGQKVSAVSVSSQDSSSQETSE